jgi:hypothetical protein
MKVDRLVRRDAISAARIEEISWVPVDVIIVDIFDEEKSALSDLAFKHEGCFGGERVWLDRQAQ